MLKKRYIALLGLVLLLLIPVTGCGGEREAKNGDTVKVHYTGTLEDGTVFDSSLNTEPLEFTLGGGKTIEGFENAILGMKVGEKKTVDIPSDQAYGEYNEEWVLEMERSEFPEDIEIEIGQQLPMMTQDGSVFYVTVVAVSETAVTVDANHRLAGKDLTFEIELVEVN